MQNNRPEEGTLPFLGEELKIERTLSGHVRKAGEVLFVPTGDGTELITEWLRKQAAVYLPQRLEIRAGELGLFFVKCKISGARRSWGSCTSEKNINLSWRLMMCERRAIDYVIVHELCHLIHMDHSPAFWAEVERILPDYRESKKWLKDHNHIMDML